MKRLQMAADLSLPVHAVTESIGILAKRRAGKSTTARRLTEQLARAKQQVVVIDPKGDWWGLRFARDGKSAGLPFVVMGGEHQDVPLERDGGELVGRLAVTERVSVILDLSEFRRDDRDFFITRFMETLYRLKAQEKYRTPAMIIIDEADLIAPQTMNGKYAADMVDAAKDLVRRGGQRGIGVTLISQRAASINKELLTQLGIMIILQTIAPQDRKAIDLWVDAHGTPEQAAELMRTLPTLDKGNGWIWAPGFPEGEGLFERHQFLLPDTYDSSATPTGGKRLAEPKHAAAVDLDAFRREMAATIKAASENDPKQLRERIRQLERELDIERHKDRGRPVSPVKAQHVVRLETSVTRLEKAQAAIMKASTEIAAGLAKAIPETPGRLLPAAPSEASSVTAALQKAVDREETFTAMVRESSDRYAAKAQAAWDGRPIAAGERVVLTAIAQHGNEGISMEQLAVLTPYKRTSRGEYVRRLKERSLVHAAGDRLLATGAGVAALGRNFTPLPTGAALREHWRRTLPRGEAAIFELTIGAYPGVLTKDAIMVTTGFKRTSTGEYLRRLKARRLIEDDGRGVKASPHLWSR